MLNVQITIQNDVLNSCWEPEKIQPRKIHHVCVSEAQRNEHEICSIKQKAESLFWGMEHFNWLPTDLLVGSYSRKSCLCILCCVPLQTGSEIYPAILTDETLSSCGDQTSYMSICLGEQDHLNLQVDHLSLEELKKKVLIFLLFIGLVA